MKVVLFTVVALQAVAATTPHLKQLAKESELDKLKSAYQFPRRRGSRRSLLYYWSPSDCPWKSNCGLRGECCEESCSHHEIDECGSWYTVNECGDCRPSCSAGRFYDKSGMKCKDCGVKKFQPSAGQFSCAACESNTNNAKATTCTVQLGPNVPETEDDYNKRKYKQPNNETPNQDVMSDLAIAMNWKDVVPFDGVINQISAYCLKKGDFTFITAQFNAVDSRKVWLTTKGLITFNCPSVGYHTKSVSLAVKKNRRIGVVVLNGGKPGVVNGGDSYVYGLGAGWESRISAANEMNGRFWVPKSGYRSPRAIAVSARMVSTSAVLHVEHNFELI